MRFLFDATTYPLYQEEHDKTLIMRTLITVFIISITIISSQSQKNIYGTLTDEQGEPLFGANVVVKGTSVGTYTNDQGHYELELPPDADLLVFSYLGYVHEEVKIGSATRIDVILKEGLNLETAVVTALGIKRSEKSIPYAVQQIDQRDLNFRIDYEFSGI